MELVGAKRKELAGAGKEELEREMRGLEGLERAIRGEGGAEKPGKGNPAGDKEAGAGSESGQGSRNRAAGPEKGKKAGMLDSLLGIFRGK